MEKKIFDLTAPQKSIWLTEQFYANTNVNNICGTVIANELLDFRTLKKAISLVIKNNDNFNLHFVEENGELKQYFENIENKDFELVELNSKDEISNLEQTLLSRVFNIKEELFEIKLFKVKNSNTCGCLINVHHIIADAYTIGLLCQNVMNNYNSLINNIPIQENSQFSYEKYINSEKEYLSSKKFENDKKYWEEKFCTLPNIVSIPSSKPISQNNDINSRRFTYTIDKNKINKINKFCSETKISIFNLFMSTLAIYMYRINNTNNFVIGTPILNRSNFNEKNIMGMFINIAPLKICIDENDSISSLLTNIATDTLGILRHQKYSYQYILEDIRKNNPSIPNLYNIVLSYQITKTVSDSNIDYQTGWAFNGKCTNDIEIHIYDTNDLGILEISYDYKTSKYNEEDIININNRLNYIIDQILENKNQKITELEIITPKEQNILINDFNNTYLKYDPDLSIIEQFESQARQTPNNPALTFKDTTYSYLELNKKSNILAHKLQEYDIKNNSIVAILLDRSIEVIVSILAILKCGAAYLPIDPDYPANRIQDILNESNINLVITKNSKFDFIKKYNNIEINVNDFYETEENIKNLPNISNKDDLAYVIYTSGSTGKPKGVTVTNKNHSNFLASMKNKVDYLNNNEKLSIISITTISFDIFGFESIISLCCGLHLFFTDYFEQKQTNLLEEYIVKNNIDIIQTTPSIMYHHINNLKDKKSFSNLKYFILAGEPLTENLVQEIFSINPNATIYNGYGPSETTIFSTFTKIDDTKHIMIGKPIDNTQIYILDDYQKLLPIGSIGEIYIGGDGVGNGYLNRPNLSNDSFIKNPFGPGKMYKTGDIGYWIEDGNIICNGRKDTQIKLHGLRIELSEIESKINNYFYNKLRSCVLLHKNEDSLIGIIEAKENIDLHELKNYLLLNLPNYMIPKNFIALEKFPQTANGKIDKKELKNIIDSQKFNISNNSNIEKPSNDVEQKLYDIISKYINREKFGITDDFFSIGLDSLTIINVVMDINNIFNTKLSIGDIYQKLNIKKLSEFLSESKNENSFNFNDFVKSTSYFETSSAQKRIYSTSQLTSNNPQVYNISGGLVFNEKLDYNKIEKCFNKIIENNPSFKTYFEILDGNLIQRISNNVYFKAGLIYDKEENINNIFKNFDKKFDFSKPPLLRALIIYTENNKTFLLISMHHIISDGTSLQILLDEFCNLYLGNDIQPKKYSYNDFINYENYFLSSKKYEKNKEFWIKEYSESIPTLNMPTTYTRPSVFSYKGNKVNYIINKEITESIFEISKKLEVTPFMFLLSIYYILLYKYTGQNEIIVGTPVANRNISEFSRIIGMFVNTLAIRKTIDSNTTFVSFLNEVKEKCLNCFSHQEFPFEKLVKELNIERDISRNPIFSTMFIYQNNYINNYNMNFDYIMPNTKSSKYDFSLEIIPKEQFELNFEYSTDLFEKKFINSFIEHYIEIIKNVLLNQNQKISELNILPLKEKNKLLLDFNKTQKKYDDNDFIYKLIDKQSLLTPNYTAITFKNNKLTYKELYEKSNSLANYLKTLGIGRNSIVGIMLPRSLELLIAIIATLKTGACYIPIDPSFPKSRIEYMLNNSNSQLLLTLENNTNYNIETRNVNLSNKEIYSMNTSLDFEYCNLSNDPSYMIYTSGSTGNPKGVILSHKGITNLTNYLNNYVEYLKNDFNNMAIASLTTVSFDIFIFETLISLQKGLNVVMATENEQTMPDLLNTLIKTNDIKAFQLTPSRMEILLNNINLIPELQNIKYITLAGEALSNKLLNRILDLGDIKIYNGYGPSETTIFSTYTDVTDHKNVTIGKPLDNTCIYILDNDNNLCPINVPGELCICGDGVGLGYNNLPKNMKNNFTLSPISKMPMYRTGDLAKFLPNGEITYIGRIDNQIKIRGLRIELDEIENKILEFPNIKKTVLLSQKDSNNRQFLIAYLTVTDKISISKLREFLRKYLPKYMIPSYFEILDDFPYLPNGKINKKELPLPKVKLCQENYVPPRNDLDNQILEIFENLLNLSPIGITDNFFELGGDSLLAINLQIELMKITDGISYADIFLNPSVKELANKISNINDVVESLSNTIELLNCNTYIENYTTQPILPEQIDIGNVLITGATGYLGIHTLIELINSTDSKIYCLIRPDKGLSIENKLKNALHFYFENKFDKYINKRIFIIQGDITLYNLGLSNTDYDYMRNNIKTIINCAAKVSHFGKYELYKKINVDGVQNLINFCKENSLRLYHTSTASVSGEYFNKIKDPALSNVSNNFKENNFYINQLIDNVYVKSKFEAEKLIISEFKNGLDAYILRIGNLMGRESDGKFQKNIEENAYINRLLSFIRIKNLPKYLKNHYLEFTPVDSCAKSIVKIATHKHNNNRIFHLLDNKKILIEDLLKIFENNYYKINLVSKEEFKNIINSLLKTSNSNQYLSGLISDFDNNGKLTYIKEILVDSEFTDSYLKSIGFEWPKIDSNYITKFLDYLNNMYKF